LGNLIRAVSDRLGLQAAAISQSALARADLSVHALVTAGAAEDQWSSRRRHPEPETVPALFGKCQVSEQSVFKKPEFSNTSATRSRNFERGTPRRLPARGPRSAGALAEHALGARRATGRALTPCPQDFRARASGTSPALFVPFAAARARERRLAGAARALCRRPRQCHAGPAPCGGCAHRCGFENAATAVSPPRGLPAGRVVGQARAAGRSRRARQ
jgi:hypothetical protein